MSDNLELLVIEKKEGVLLTNIDKLETFVQEKLKEYTPDNYKGDADAAKKDRATLNTSKKTLSQERIKVIKELMKPFEDFETRCKALEKNIDAAALALDEIVKAKEAAGKEVKRAGITEYFNTRQFSLVPLEKIFDDKWLNKTVKMKAVQEEIDAKIKKIYADIKTIEAFGVDVETLRPLYLETLDIGATIERGRTIQENRERLEKESAERAEREKKAKMQEQQSELAKEEVRAQEQAPVASLAQKAAGVPVDEDPEMTYTLRFKAKKSVLFALRQYMLDNKIEYEKLED
jgi:DNA-binding transcriptional MerR regulator